MKDRPKLIVVDEDDLIYDKPEPIENLITWVYEEGSFVPTAKIIGEEKFSIINDYIGRAVQVYSELGELVWETDYDIYGSLKDLRGDRSFIPFRQLGQYEDTETGLYYNRHRYYSSETGLYLSQDPIGLMSDEPNFYAYVPDSNSWVDIFGLATEFAIGSYGSLTGPAHVGDNLTAHELLQSACLRQNHGITRSSSIGQLNPSIALTEPNMHKNITSLQNTYKMGGNNLKGQTALQNINRNAALTRRGIYEGLLSRGWEPANAKKYATDLTIKLREDAIDFAKKQGYIKCH